MELKELQAALKDMVEGKHFEREMWRYIDDQMQGVIMYWQKDQLFEKSIGADGVKLGTYNAHPEGSFL